MSVFLIIIAIIVGPWLLMYVGLSSLEDPPKPTFTYGEFPFHLEYKINGQRKIVDDKVIVEYDGIGLNEGAGKYIQWKPQTLASGNEEVILFEDGESVRIYLAIRDKDYNMEDWIDYSEYNYVFPSVIKEEKLGRGNYATSLSENDLINNYKIRLIEFKYGEPLRN